MAPVGGSDRIMKAVDTLSRLSLLTSRLDGLRSNQPRVPRQLTSKRRHYLETETILDKSAITLTVTVEHG